MKKEQVKNIILETGLLAVIRGNDEKQALDYVAKCVEGGVKAIELTFTVPYAHKVIETVARKYEGTDVVVGAGTVLDSETARIAILSGAEFIVSPCFNVEMVKLCNRYGKLVVPGIMTITEAVTALEAGVEILKLFPGDAYGPSFIKALKAPIPNAEIIPTGGVSKENIGEWINAGACAVGAGSLLTKGDIVANSKEMLAKIKAARDSK